MKAPLALAIAAAFVAPAALAHSGDMWQGTYVQPGYVIAQPVEVQSVEVTRVEPVDEVTVSTPVTGSRIAPVEYTTTSRNVVYEDRVVRGEPIVVEATTYAYLSPNDVLLRPGYPDLSGYPDRTSALNPQTGQLNDYGLFNRRGPNDFGR